VLLHRVFVGDDDVSEVHAGSKCECVLVSFMYVYVFIYCDVLGGTHH
jgi:hypothetical protein